MKHYYWRCCSCSPLVGLSIILFAVSLVETLVNVNVEFVSHPLVVSTVGSGKIIVHGCKYNSSIRFDDRQMYYILNNTNGSSTVPGTTPILTDGSIKSNFRPFVEINSFQQFGTYQCVVFDPDRMKNPVLSMPTNTSAFLPRFEAADINVKTVSIGDPFEIVGCQLRTPFTTGLAAYWTKDGEWYKASDLMEMRNEKNVALKLYQLKNLKKEVATVNDTGVFACVVAFQNGTRVSEDMPSVLSLEAANITVPYLEPKFREVPRLQISTTDFIVSGCQYLSDRKFDDSHTYLLLNDSRVSLRPLPGGRSGARRKRRRASFVDEYIFPEYQINSYNFTGYYQCVIFDPEKMPKPVVSNRSVLITLPVPTVHLSVAISSSTTAGSSLLLRGCDIRDNKINLKPDGYYWLKNGHKKIFINVTERKDLGALFTFPNLNFPSVKITDNGTYQCVIHLEGLNEPLLSPPIEVKVEEIKPKIIGLPRLHKYIYEETSYVILGCRYRSTKDFRGYTYLLLNGSRVNLPPLPVPRKRRASLEFDYNFPEYQITHYNFTGYYQCAIFDPETMLGQVVSNSSDFIKIPELKVTFLSSPEWRVTKDSIQLVGCRYKIDGDQSDVNIAISYGILMNGTSYRSLKKSVSLQNGTFNDTTQSIDITTFTQVGSYFQCVIQDLLVKEEKTFSERSTAIKASDVLPVFPTGPNVQYPQLTGGQIRLSGCAISSKLSLGRSVTAYWLKNGVEKIPARLVEREPTGQEDFRMSHYQFNEFEKSESNYTDHGFYQCLLMIPEFFQQTQIVSNETDVQFKDIATTRMTVRMDRAWDDKLKDPDSLEYKSLEQKVVSEIQSSMEKDNDTTVIVRVLGFSKGSVTATTQLLFVNVTTEERKTQCENVATIAKRVENIKSLDVLSVDSKSLDCCVEDKIGDIPFKGEYNYSKTLESTTVINNCSYARKWQRLSAQNTRQCQGNLRTGPRWSNTSLEDCPAKTKTTNDLIELSKVSICINNRSVNCRTPAEIARNMSSIVSQDGAITIRQDVLYIETIIRQITNAPTTFDDVDEAIEITEDIVATVSGLVATDRKIVTEAQRYTQSASSILLLLDDFAKRLGEVVKKTNRTISIGRKNAAFAVKYIQPSYVNVSISEKEESGNVTISIESKEESLQAGESSQSTGTFSQTKQQQESQQLSSSQIPPEAFQKTSKVVYSFFFKYDTLFQTNGDLKASQPPRLQSNVLAVTVGNERIENLAEPVTLKFRKVIEYKLDKDVNLTSVCTFWNFNVPTSIPNVNGTWSRKGCKKTGETERFIECQCTHLTNFAILLDVSQTQQSPLELEIVTWIGCGISLAGLLATFITYLIFPKLRQKLPPKILLCLTLSLMLLLVIFLGAVDAENVDSHRGCQVVSGLIQYFTLTSFFWMAVEAVNLYRNFVTIFGGGSNRKFLKAACLFAWGIPLIIVILCGSLSPDDFGSERFCVVQREAFYYGVLLPVAFILFCNLVVLFLVMRSLSNSKRSMLTSKKDGIKSQLKIALACSTLLGLTWILGLFAVGDLREVFQWLFTIFNSLQGLFIFIFYTAKNKDARKEWKNVCGGRSSYKANESNTNGNTNSTALVTLKGHGKDKNVK